MSGQVDATEVQVAPEVGGRIVEMTIAEGDRVKQGDVVARLDTRDVDLALRRAQAERSQADAQLRLLQAGARGEDIRQAEAQAAAAAADVAAAAGRPRRRRDGPAAIRAASRGRIPDRRNSATMRRHAQGTWRRDRVTASTGARGRGP